MMLEVDQPMGSSVINPEISNLDKYELQINKFLNAANLVKKSIQLISSTYENYQKFVKSWIPLFKITLICKILNTIVFVWLEWTRAPIEWWKWKGIFKEKGICLEPE